jgi:4-hydroxy-tetrahydrodipicolinate synthase
MVDRTMRGVYPILAMPFDAQYRIDVEDLQKEVEFCIAGGAHGLGIAMASEIFKLSEAERDLATKTVVDQVNGRVPVVVNTGAHGTDLAIEYSKRAQELGADAVMVIKPTAIPTTDSEVREYFRRISSAISIPIFQQDIGTAPLGPGLIVQIANEAEMACYAKVESPPTPPRVAEAVERGGTKLIVFGGAGGNFFLEELRRGSVGTMPGSTIPEVFRKTWDLYQNGDDDGATRCFSRYGGLLRELGQALGISFHLTKEVMRLRGVFKTNLVRHPAARPDDLAFIEIRRMIESLELETARV